MTEISTIVKHSYLSRFIKTEEHISHKKIGTLVASSLAFTGSACYLGYVAKNGLKNLTSQYKAKNYMVLTATTLIALSAISFAVVAVKAYFDSEVDYSKFTMAQLFSRMVDTIEQTTKIKDDRKQRLTAFNEAVEKWEDAPENKDLATRTPQELIAGKEVDEAENIIRNTGKDCDEKKAVVDAFQKLKGLQKRWRALHAYKEIFLAAGDIRMKKLPKEAQKKEKEEMLNLINEKMKSLSEDSEARAFCDTTKDIFFN